MKKDRWRPEMLWALFLNPFITHEGIEKLIEIETAKLEAAA
jgi:hypothetical protein